jgi:alpha-D-xyloside xylohydrolase
MRPLIMDFNGDPEIYNISDQYMFGPSLLVAPVYKYKSRSREVYLPASSGWYDFYSGKYLKGGQRFIADAPYEKLPLFVREGTILPVGPEIQYTSEKKPDTLIIFVYTGKDCDFKLYEDEGSNYNYEKGSYSTILFSYNEAKREVTIGERKGSFSGMLKTRTFKIVFISKEKMVTFNPEITPDVTTNYDGNERKVIQQNQSGH